MSIFFILSLLVTWSIFLSHVISAVRIFLSSSLRTRVMQGNKMGCFSLKDGVICQYSVYDLHYTDDLSDTHHEYATRRINLTLKKTVPRDMQIARATTLLLCNKYS